MELVKSSFSSIGQILEVNFPVKNIPRKNVVEYYGAIHNLADHCEINNSHVVSNNLVWQHGWKPNYFNITPKLIIGHNKWQPEYTHLVARQDQMDFLQASGYRKVKAMGLPICYVPDVTYPRIPNSLLVMPVHSLAYTEHSHWDFQQYAETINSLSTYFDRIVICVHPSCFKKGYWVKEFQEFGLEVVEGADTYDRNALSRMQFLFKSFEYVTTNSFGSQIAYAALFGAKVSIFGRFCEMKVEDFRGSKYYLDNPEILSPTVNLISEKVTRANFPFLFVNPKEAIERRGWAKKEVGYDLKLAPREIKQIFGWGPIQLLNNQAKNYAKAIYKVIKRARVNFPQYWKKD